MAKFWDTAGTGYVAVADLIGPFGYETSPYNSCSYALI